MKELKEPKLVEAVNLLTSDMRIMVARAAQRLEQGLAAPQEVIAQARALQSITGSLRNDLEYRLKVPPKEAVESVPVGGYGTKIV